MSEKPIGRGRFTEKPPAGEQIDLNPTARQVRWMKFLNLHGPLPSSYLFELEGEKSETERRSAQEQLRRLWRGGFVLRPVQQRATDNSNYHEYVYDLTEQGRVFLQDNGHWREALRPSGNWVHQLFVACVTASIDIHCQREGYRYIPPHEYLDGRSATVAVPFKWIDGTSHTLPMCPDALFAIDYGNESFIAYALEADRNTEPSTSKLPTRKTDTRTVKQYVSFIGGKLYKRAYSRDAMMMMLFITVSETRARRFLQAVADEKESCSYIATGVVPEFETPFRPPQLLTHLFAGELQRAGKEAFCIKKTA